MLCRNTLNAKNKLFLNSNFRRVLNIAFFLLGEYPTSEFYMPKFRNTPFHFHIKTEHCSETSVYKIQTPVIHPKEGIRQELEACIKGNGGPVATRSTSPKESPALQRYHYTHLPRYDEWQLL